MVNVVKIGGGIKLLKLGFGAMGMSVMGELPQDQLFETLKYVVDQATPDAKVVINSSEHYGPQAHNLKILSRFFTAHPELSDRAFVVVKGALSIFEDGHQGPPVPNSSPEALRRSAENVANALHPKKVDVFELGRIDKRVQIEDAMKTLLELRKEGLFDHIGLSECAASTLRRAAAVAPITTVEIEISPMNWEEEAKKVLEAAEDPSINAAILAYSPMARGALSGKSYEELNPLIKKMFPRFQGENWEENKKLQEKMKALAEKKDVSIGQLSIAWVMSTSPQVIPIPGTTKISRAQENFASLNVQLTDEERQEVTALVEATETAGQRFPGVSNDQNWG